MTKKRFKLRLSKLGNGMITDTQKREDLYFDKEFLNTTLPKTNEWLNELADKNEQLKSELDYWKKRALLLEHRYDESSDVEWLRNNTVWEQMPSSRKRVTKTSLRPKPTK